MAVLLGVLSMGMAYDCPGAEPPPPGDLSGEIAALKARVAELEARQRAAAADAEAKSTAAQVEADAARRSTLGGGELDIKYSGGKLTFQSRDKSFLFHPWLQLQFRNTTNFREDAKSDGDNDLQNGFEVRRMKLGFDGNIFSPKTTYLFNWATNRNSGNFQLEEAWVRHAFSDEWALMGGQLKGPFAHESMMSSKRLLAADRTLMTDLFTGGDNYVQGISGIYTRDALRAYATFHDGARNNFNQNFQDFPTNNADWGSAGRVEYKFGGDWKAYDDFTAMGTKEQLTVIGGGIDYTEAGNTGFLLQTVDAQYEHPSGLGLYAAFMGRYTRNAPVSPTTPTGPESDLYDWGFTAQAAYLVRPKWEPFVRYEFLHFDPDGLAADAENDVHVFTGGVNYYWHGHDAKFTIDTMYLPNGSPVSDDGAGILASDGEAELILRAQFQLLL